jgi:hypothetical protein
MNSSTDDLHVRTRTESMKSIGLPVLIFIVVFTAYLSSPIITTFDSKWVVYVSMSIIKEGNTNLDEYEDLLAEKSYNQIRRIDGHLYSKFPIGVSIVALPFVYLIDTVTALSPSMNTLNKDFKKRIPRGVDGFIASFISALTAVFVYLVVALFFDTKKVPLILVFIFTFCTSSWSTASRALWQHGPSMLFLTITLYLILLARNRPALIQYSSVPLAFSYFIRPTNGLSLFVLTVFVLIQYRSYFLRYILWSLMIFVPFLVYNLNVYTSLTPSYYQFELSQISSRFYVALAGHLMSPSRGLFIFSPVLLFSIYGIYMKMKKGQFNSLDFSILGIILLHWIVISMPRGWWGGNCFGPRYFSDLIPYFVYFMIPSLTALFDFSGFRRKIFISTLSVFIAVSFFINSRGATSQAVYDWYSDPPIKENQERLWDWHDIQFLRGL